MDTCEMKAISEETYQQWFNANYPTLQHCSPFHQPAWLGAVAQGIGFTTCFVGVFEGKELVTAVPGFLMGWRSARLWGSPLRGTMTSYLGPVSVKTLPTGDELVEFIARCNDFVRREWRALSTRFTLRNVPSEGELQLPTNWKRQRSGSYRLDLTGGQPVVWNRLKSDCRRNIRKAKLLEIETMPFEDGQLYYHMLNDTLKRHGTVNLHPERFFSLLLSELVPHDLMWAWSARYEDNIIGVGLFLHDVQEVHFVSGASLPQYGTLPTSYLLHWRAIEEGMRQGLRIFNSDASRVRSIDQFKESFRPVLEKRYTLMWAPGYMRSTQKLFISTTRLLRRVKSRF